MKLLLLVIVLVLLVFPRVGNAGDMWLTVPLYSYHTSNQGKYNDKNYGLGFEYHINDEFTLAAGMFRNSNFNDSGYLGGAYTPLRLGDFKFGGFVGAFTGYRPEAMWGLLPLMAYEHPKGWGGNLVFVPPIHGNVGAFALQLKMRLP